MYRKSRISFLIFMLTFLLVVFSYSDTWAEGEPYFQFCNVMALNTPDGVQTALTAMVFDPNGTVPVTISTFTVAGPGGFAFSFTADDYVEGFNVYWHGIPALPADGEYTFTVTDNEGKVATTHYYLEVGSIIPPPDSSTLQASGDPLSPTLSWGVLSGYQGSLFYLARIYDMDFNFIWESGFTTESSVNVPAGILIQPTLYQWRVEAFDSYHYFVSNNWAVSQTVPLSIDDNRPYFTWAAVYNRQNPDGFFYTTILADVTDPNGSLPDSISNFAVTGPGGFTYTFQPEDFDPGWGIFEHSLDGRPQDGIYTFTVTDNEGKTAVTFDYVKTHDVPLVDASSLQASGDPLAPTLSWGAPAGMDRSLYYRVIIKDAEWNEVWRSGRTSLTYFSVPQGILQQGVSYRWNVRACDDKRWVHIDNRSHSDYVDLVIDDARPYFEWAIVHKLQKPDGFYIAPHVRVVDPNGSLPDSITSATVTGPGGFSYTFQPEDYLPSWNQYYHKIPGRPAEGVYTITVTDIEGKTSITRDYVQASDDIPMVDEAAISVTGDPLAPTVSWGGISGYQGPLYYRLLVVDTQFKPIYLSGRGPETARTIPGGILEPDTPYLFYIEAHDHYDWVVFNSRSDTQWLQLFECEEDDTGALDIVGKTGAPGGTVTIPVRIQNALNEIDSLGFEVTFIPNILSYTGFTRGPLVENFDFFNVSNPETGLIRIGGFEAGADTIPPGASGDVVYLNFNVKTGENECEPGLKYLLDLQELKDDIATWSTSLGCFRCGCSCDVNEDGEVTPQDALCAFQKYLGIDPTACGPAEEICCDVTMDDDCTPADALEIFKCYLGLESLCPPVECE